MRSLIHGIAKVLRTNADLTAKDRLEFLRELRENLAKLTRRLDNIEPKADRTYNFLWNKMRDGE